MDEDCNPSEGQIKAAEQLVELMRMEESDIVVSGNESYARDDAIRILKNNIWKHGGCDEVAVIDFLADRIINGG